MVMAVVILVATSLAVVQMLGQGRSSQLVLAGLAIAFVAMSIANLLIYLGDPKATHTVMFWMLGGLGGAKWSMLWIPALCLLVCGLALMSQSKKLDAMSVSDGLALSLGIHVSRFRMWILTVTALLTATLVAFSGVIGFVGLMVPHMARLLVGASNARVLPVSALLGAAFLLLADTLARTLFAPQELPIGILTGLVGGLFFLGLLYKDRRASAH